MKSSEYLRLIKSQLIHINYLNIKKRNKEPRCQSAYTLKPKI